MIVDLVNVLTRDDVRLDGILRVPSRPNASSLGVDVVILHHGVGGNFYNPGMFDQYSNALLDRGCAVLRVNNRGHDPVSRATVGAESKRLGAAYEDMESCHHDWDAWIGFARAAGYQRIGLWGHSLGATKSIYYMAAREDDRVKCVVAGSPPRFSYSAFAATSEGDAFLRSADEARRHVEGGHPDALLDVIYPVPLLIAAGVFMEKYGPDEQCNISRFIPRVRIPLLIMVGTEEARTMMAFKGLPKEVEKLAGELANLTFESIPGADHAYTNQRDYVWGVVSRWLAKV